jgi:putative transposase
MLTIAIKAIKQSYSPTPQVLELLEIFRKMVNNCIRIGLKHNVSTMKALSKLCYHELDRYCNVISYYKLCAISRAAGILAARRKSLRRGYAPKSPYAVKPILISCYGFKIENNVLRVPLGNRKYFDILLNHYSRQILSFNPSLTVRSFTLTSDSVIIAISRGVNEIECVKMAGIDRNLRNLTVGNPDEIVQYDLSKAVDIVENTVSIVRSFRRNDVRIRKKLSAKYGVRRKNRINQLLHHVSKAVVQSAKKSKTALVFEDITHIRRLYKQGNGQGKTYRSKMNSWSFSEIKRQIEYKAIWEGITVIQLSKSETRCTSSQCPRCGERLQVGQLKRSLWCATCRREFDRDIVAAMNISYKGRSRFDRSQGDADEAMKGNLERDPIILRVNASKLLVVTKRQVNRTV